MRPLLTVMIPSRGRPQGLLNFIESFGSGPVEFIVRLDDDDKEALVIHGIKTIIGPRLLGYESIHTFCNEMLLQATGQWIMLGNDDATMLSEDWAKILSKEKPRCVLLNCGNEHGNSTPIFPIVNTDICKELGHFSLNAFTDRWLSNIYPPDKIKDIPIRIKHDIIKDQSSEDRKTAYEYSTDDWDNTTELRKQIMDKLRNHD